MNFFKVCLFTAALVGSAMGRPQVGGPSFSLEAEEEPFNDHPVYTYSYQVADDDEQTYISHNEDRDGADVTGSYSYVDANGALVTVRYTAGAMGYTEERDVQDNFIVLRNRPAAPQQPAAPARGSSSSSFGSRQTTTTTSSSSTGGNSGVVSQVVQAVRPVVETTVSQSSSSSTDDSDLVARILAQLTPFIQQTVSSSLGGQQQTTRTTTTRRVQSAPQQTTRTVVRPVATAPTRSASSSSTVEGIFGVQGANNVQFQTPEFNYEFDLQ